MYAHLPSVPHAVDRQGFVLVDGERVLNTPGVMLRSRPADTYTCQLCGQRTAPHPNRVVSEFEHAIGAVRYFHAAEPGVPSHCAACAKAATP